ncbi:MAG TPA: Nramp family divalent metal transporter, partial [Vicinamibacterales bacterium]|nr:Nramp family divalent metal transporter [Vicinamibacterales bacterium]
PPPPFTLRNALRTVGPGVIGLGIAIGSGEWLIGPAVILKYGPALLWITTISVFFQVILNQEMARYTLYTGEPIITGFMRTRPGASFWGWTYGVLAFCQYGWPGWALGSATATAALLYGRMPTSADAGAVIAIGYATFVLCFVIVTVGRKIERTIELAMWTLVCAILLYLLLVDLFAVSGDTWRRVAGGFASVGRLPPGADWVLLGAFAAYSGLGGIGNALTTNYMRDKGYGMSATVGYIPAAMAEARPLPPHGNVFEVNAGSLRAWRQWWKYVHLDQWAIFGFGSVFGMALTALFTLEFVPAGTEAGEWAVANLQATGIAAAHGPVFWYLTILCGMGILFSSQLGIVDGLPRAVTDIVWAGSPRLRRVRDVRRIYYGVLGLFLLWGCIALNLARPLTLIIIGANAAAVIFVVESLHTLVVNRRFLPRALRAPLWREACLVLCAAFYGSFVVFAVVTAVAGRGAN